MVNGERSQLSDYNLPNDHVEAAFSLSETYTCSRCRRPRQRRSRTVIFLITVTRKVHAAFLCFLDLHDRFPPRWKPLHRGRKRFHHSGNLYTTVENAIFGIHIVIQLFYHSISVTNGITKNNKGLRKKHDSPIVNFLNLFGPLSGESYGKMHVNTYMYTHSIKNWL